MTDITIRRPIVWNSSALTHVGKVRQVNEDAVLAKPDIGLWAVADGMGGHRVGDLASSKIIAALEAVEPCADLNDYVNAVEDAVLKVNQHMLDYAQAMFESGTMGSTLVALLLRERMGICLWVGDSRLYRFRSQQLQQLSRDHSQVEEMIAMGLLTRSAAMDYPNKNVITRAVGVEAQLCLEITLFSAQVGDIFLLCSDGLYNCVSDQDIQQTLTLRDTQAISARLLDMALANGAPDNVSAIVVQGSLGKLEF